MVILWIFAGLILFFVMLSAIEQRFISISHYKVSSGKLSEKDGGFSFVLLADLHNTAFGKGNYKLINRIKELKPDFIILAGDMVSRGRKCVPGNTFTMLETLAGSYQIYYAIGNHEQHFIMLNEDIKSGHDSLYKRKLYASWKEFVSGLSSKGICFLDNQSITRKQGKNDIVITGISIEDRFYGKADADRMEADYLETIAGKRPKNGYQIVIAHNPIYFKQYKRWGADLTLSGHTHGGLIRLPYFGGIISPQYRFFPKYDAGIFTENDRTMIVSRGLGTHSCMPRLFNRPELVYARVTGVQSKD